jgi:hypothetical protein
VFPACCGRWNCPQAGKRRSARLRARLLPVPWRAMATFTLSGDGSPTVENQRRLTSGIRSVIQWCRRRAKLKGRDYHYVWMKECGSSTHRLHAHLLWTMPFLRQSELSLAAARCGLGTIVDVRATYALNGRGGFRSGSVGYITKYVTKNQLSGLPKNSRRFQTWNVDRYRAEPGWSWSSTPLQFRSLSTGRTFWLLADRFLPVHSIPKTTTASVRGPPIQLSAFEQVENDESRGSASLHVGELAQRGPGNSN